VTEAVSRSRFGFVTYKPSTLLVTSLSSEYFLRLAAKRALNLLVNNDFYCFGFLVLFLSFLTLPSLSLVAIIEALLPEGFNV